MDKTVVTLELPVDLYDKLQALAAEEQMALVDVVDQLVTVAHQRRGWLRELNELREQIRRDGGLQVGATKEEIIERLRQSRREIFEAEYAHLYR